MTTIDRVYYERISSNRTESLFIVLAILCFLLFVWFAGTDVFNTWSILFVCLFAFFLFYTLNFKTLIIRLSKNTLRLQFGIFTWKVPLHNIETCFLDTTSLARIGGAGIHFTPLGGRYRAMFNFLEYPRVVIALKVKQGPVRDIAFSTRHPDEIMQLIKNLRLPVD